ncbi:MAG: hypothetical protein EHM28_03465 [Spirochaetaceae bacterium]|nr:MAG: hypothetical protein EHM28_03465 [Spirochaetaceae bacterium]
MKPFYKPVFIAFCFCTVMVAGASAQAEVLPTPDSFRVEAEYFYVGMKTDVKIIEINAQVLGEFEKTDMSLFTKLETVIISFSEDPQALFAKKQTVIDMVRKNLDYLAELKDCPVLKNIVLQVGEMLFIRGTEKLSGEEADKQNLFRTGKEYAEKIKSILPGVKIYAHNWGW